MKYWRIIESLDRRIALQKQDSEAYSHTVTSATLWGILTGLVLYRFVLHIINIWS